jgi:hypothetical protein
MNTSWLSSTLTTNQPIRKPLFGGAFLLYIVSEALNRMPENGLYFHWLCSAHVTEVDIVLKTIERVSIL